MIRFINAWSFRLLSLRALFALTMLLLLIHMSGLPMQLGIWLRQNRATSETRICSSEERHRFLHEMCLETEQERNLMTEKHQSRFIFDRKNKLLFCEVSKAGCSAWKGIFIDHALNQTQSARADVKGIHSATAVEKTNISLIGQWLPEFNNYTNILFVRHPLDRVVSAFYNVKYFKAGTGMHGPGGEVRHRIKNLFELQSLTELQFSDFVRFITDKELSGQLYYDRHYDSYVKTCRVCSVKYDYILRTESMNYDALPILKDLGFSDKYIESMQKSDNTRPEVSHGSKISTDKVLKELRQLNGDEYRQLLERYKFDFQLFGYDIDQQSNIATCSIETKSGTCC